MDYTWLTWLTVHVSTESDTIEQLTLTQTERILGQIQAEQDKETEVLGSDAEAHALG